MLTPHPVLAAIVQSTVSPTADEWQELLAVTTTERFAKGSILLEDGAHNDRLHLMVEGVCRHYFLDADGNEVTSWFSEPGMLATDYRAFTEGAPSLFTIQALTDVVCMAIRSKDMQAL